MYAGCFRPETCPPRKPSCSPEGYAFKCVGISLCKYLHATNPNSSSRIASALSSKPNAQISYSEMQSISYTCSPSLCSCSYCTLQMAGAKQCPRWGSLDVRRIQRYRCSVLRLARPRDPRPGSTLDTVPTDYVRNCTGNPLGIRDVP